MKIPILDRSNQTNSVMCSLRQTADSIEEQCCKGSYAYLHRDFNRHIWFQLSTRFVRTVEPLYDKMSRLDIN